MVELFIELAIDGDMIQDEDLVIHLLASPYSFSRLFTALEANELLKMEIVTERILHEEMKQKEKNNSDLSTEKAMTTKQPY